MKLLQLNLNHCQAAQDLLKQSVRELNIDFALLSEQYCNIDSPKWVTDSTSTSAIWSVRGQMLQDIMMTRQDGFVRANVSGVSIYSCYIPPRYSDDAFRAVIGNLVSDAMDKGMVLIAGDFNAWAIEWGCPRTNERGRILLESFAMLDVVLVNTGNEQTFNRNGSGSVIDIAFASASIANRIDWSISDMYTYSDHCAIIMEIRDTPHAISCERGRTAAGWKTNTLDNEIFNFYIEDMTLNGTPDDMAGQFINQLTHACNASMKRRGQGPNKTPVYWWNEEIAQLRKDCIQARRVYVRARGRQGSEANHLKPERKPSNWRYVEVRGHASWIDATTLIVTHLEWRT